MDVLLHITIYAGESAGDRSFCAAPSFTYITAVAAADDGTIFAVDFANNRILKWRPVAKALPGA